MVCCVFEWMLLLVFELEIYWGLFYGVVLFYDIGYGFFSYIGEEMFGLCYEVWLVWVIWYYLEIYDYLESYVFGMVEVVVNLLEYGYSFYFLIKYLVSS